MPSLPFGGAGRRVPTLPAIAILAWLLLAFLPLFKVAYRLDLEIFLQAARDTWEGLPIYHLSKRLSEHTKPPLATLLFMPLAYLNAFWVHRAWDGLNMVLTFVLIRDVARDSSSKDANTASVAAILLLWILGPLISEYALGQYNLLTLWMIYRARRSPLVVSGLLSVVAVLLKPTNLVLIPWLYSQSPKAWRLLKAQTVIGLALAALYAGIFGWGRLISDHVEWLHFGPVSHAVNALRTFNYGLPTQISRAFPGILPITAFFFLPATLLATALPRLTRDPMASLGLSCVLMLCISPMVWFQNFVCLLPLVAALRFRCAAGEWRYPQWGLAILYLCTQIYNPTLLGRALFTSLAFVSPPLWGMLAAAAFLALSLRQEARARTLSA